MQYMVAVADNVLFEYAGGWADIQNRRPMTPDTTLMAYSMTKTITAVAILQLAAQRKLRLDDTLDLALAHPPLRGPQHHDSPPPSAHVRPA
jgi:CubicO group peptidase (beta-lactamase class C family)